MIRKFLVPQDGWTDSYAKVCIEPGDRRPDVPWGWDDDISVGIADCDRKVTLDFSFPRGDKKKIAAMRKKLERIYDVLDPVAEYLEVAALSCEEDAVARKAAKDAYNEANKGRRAK